MRGGALAALAANEWFKLRKRPAFWLPLAAYGLIAAMGMLPVLLADLPDGVTLALPAGWGWILGNNQLLVLIAGVCVMLLTAAEFRWRTARQNVIDGLSKAQWFWGKTLVLPMIALAFLALHLLVTVPLALYDTDFGAASGPLVPGGVLPAVGGHLLAVLSLGSFGLFLAMTLRRTGASIAVWFLWVGPLESGFLNLLVGRYVPEYLDWMDYAPFATAMGLLEYDNYGAGEAVPFVWAALAWIAVFVGGALAGVMRRDL